MSESYSEPDQMSKIEVFVKIVNSFQSTFPSLILNVSLGSEYLCDDWAGMWWKMKVSSVNIWFSICCVYFVHRVKIKVFGRLLLASHCVKSVRIRNYSGPYLSVFSSNAGKYGPELLRIRTLFTHANPIVFMLVRMFHVFYLAIGEAVVDAYSAEFMFWKIL